MKAIFLGVMLCLTAACASVGNTIGGGALTIETVANIVQRECGNAQPNGPCLATSRISTIEKNDFKRRLQEAQYFLVDANAAREEGNTAAARGRLHQVNAILSAIESWLIARGITE